MDYSDTESITISDTETLSSSLSLSDDKNENIIWNKQEVHS